MPSAKSVAPGVPMYGRKAVAKSAPPANDPRVDVMREQRRRRNQRRDGNEGGNARADGGLDARETQIGARQAFIDDRALLKEQHPRRYRRANVGHQEHQERLVHAAR